MLFPPSMGLRIPAASAPNEPLCANEAGIFHRRAEFCRGRTAVGNQRAGKKLDPLYPRLADRDGTRKPDRIDPTACLRIIVGMGHRKMRGMVLHADDARVVRAFDLFGSGLRLHGRAEQVPLRTDPFVRTRAASLQ